MSAFVCAACGGDTLARTPVLWPGLVGVAAFAGGGGLCRSAAGRGMCRLRANFRSIALAKAICQAVGSTGTLKAFVASAAASEVRLLELNTARTLNPFLTLLPGHTSGAYPEVDIAHAPYDGGTFDLVVHSDTLEHIERPVHALVECRRVLKPGGSLCFTVPVIVGRMTRSRAGLPESFHGAPGLDLRDYLVQTEFGADIWTYVMRAGFSHVSLMEVGFPAAIAIEARRS